MKQRLYAVCVVGSAVSALLTIAPCARAGTNVWVNVGPDFSNLLDLATADKGLPAFTATEKLAIQNKVMSELQRIYAGYNVNFSFTDPGGDRDIINLATTYTANTFGPYGSTPTNGIGNYITNATATVFPRNFNLVLGRLPAGDHANQLGIEMGLVAAHELSHIFGLNHWLKYGDATTNPSNYNAVPDAYLHSIMSVPSEPLGVEGRYNLNRFERAMFDITGGTLLSGQSLVNHPVYEVLEGIDAGATPATAKPLAFSQGETSGMRLAMMQGQLDNTPTDVDVYKFTATSPGALSVAVFSGSSASIFNQNRNFNSRLRLIGPDGATVVADFDDLYYQGDVYNAPTYTDFAGFQITVPKTSDDPFMINVPVGLGTYYLEISPVSGNEIGDGYQFLAAFDGSAAPVPEPTTAAVLTTAAAGLTLTRRRRKP